MATVSLTASGTQLDEGTAYDLTVVNTGSTAVHVQVGGGSVFNQRLNPGQSVVVHPQGQPVTAVAPSGDGEVETTGATSPQPVPSGASGTAAPIAWKVLTSSANQVMDTPFEPDAQALITFDTLHDSSGEGITWSDTEDSHKIYLAQDGWYGAYLTVFWNEQAADADASQWAVSLGFGIHAGEPFNPINPYWHSGYQPGGVQATLAWPMFRVTQPGQWLQCFADVRNITTPPEIYSPELAVYRFA